LKECLFSLDVNIPFLLCKRAPIFRPNRNMNLDDLHSLGPESV
jgi:hypothetical protein